MTATITVTGSGSASGIPNRVHLMVAVQTQREGVAESLTTSGDIVSAVVSAARGAGLDQADISTRNVFVQESRHPQTREVEGYRSTHNLGLVVRDLARTSEVVNAIAAAAGNALSVNGIELTIADRSTLSAQARTLAVIDATQKAEQLAHVADKDLGPLMSLTEGGNDTSIALTAEAAFTTSMPLETGQQTVTETVTMTWTLLD